jgi:hypothetical protein
MLWPGPRNCLVAKSPIATESKYLKKAGWNISNPPFVIHPPPQPTGCLFESAGVDLVAQQLGAPENNDPPLGKHHVTAGGGIASPPGFFVLDAEFPESTYQNIFTVFHLAFDDLKQGLDDFNAFFSGDTKFFRN